MSPPPSFSSSCTLYPDSCPPPSTCFPERNFTCGCVSLYGYQNPPTCSEASWVTIMMQVFLIGGLVPTTAYLLITTSWALRYLYRVAWLKNLRVTDRAFITLIVVVVYWITWALFLLGAIVYSSPHRNSIDNRAGDGGHRIAFLFEERTLLVSVAGCLIMFAIILFGSIWYQMSVDAKYFRTSAQKLQHIRLASFGLACSFLIVVCILFSAGQIMPMMYTLGGMCVIMCIAFLIGSYRLTQVLKSMDDSNDVNSSRADVAAAAMSPRTAQSNAANKSRYSSIITGIRRTALQLSCCIALTVAGNLVNLQKYTGLTGHETSLLENSAPAFAVLVVYYGLNLGCVVLLNYGKGALLDMSPTTKFNNLGVISSKADPVPASRASKLEIAALDMTRPESSTAA